MISLTTTLWCLQTTSTASDTPLADCNYHIHNTAVLSWQWGNDSGNSGNLKSYSHDIAWALHENLCTQVSIDYLVLYTQYTVSLIVLGDNVVSMTLLQATMYVTQYHYGM